MPANGAMSPFGRAEFRSGVGSGTVDWELLEGVPAEEVRLLLSVARRRRFARREVVFHRDDPADSLHLVSKGRFAIQTATPVGDTFMIGVRGAGHSFGEMALVGSHTRSATIVALEPSETFSIYEGDFQRLQAQHEAINRALLNFLASEVRSLHDTFCLRRFTCRSSAASCVACPTSPTCTAKAAGRWWYR